MIGPFTTDMYLPAFSAIAEGLDTLVPEVGYSLSSYFAGICIGQLIHGPLIDRFGRRNPLLIFLSLYIIMSLACSWTNSIEGLIIFRFFQAFAGSCGMVVNRAVVRDLFPPGETAKVFSKLILVMGVAPIIAPTVGGFVVEDWGWRAVFWVLASIGAVVLAAVIWSLPESKAPDKSVSLRLPAVMRNYGKTLANPLFIPFVIAGAMNTGGLFAYISGSSYVYIDLYGLDVKTFGWIFGGNAACFILGSQINRIFLKYSQSHKVVIPMVAFQLLNGIILAFMVYQGTITLPIMIVLIGFYTLCLGMVGPNALALALSPFTENVGVASAALGSVQMGMGALASALVSLFAGGSALSMAAVMAGATAIGLIGLIFGVRMIRRTEWMVAGT
ncbi:Bcr/CflA family drug resistance efflux transporter [Flavilitoribacter nigricans DSM 23189 = NBRC 102662]|uniref:Bcr/CflA family drug resistance efflux transporter n=2 Tax=Flavilitoribacter TaxID=2762562 RepID=A0A2D0ND93_FLAN2|nr:Bcr/CflA family drug resistance efflux transporter [Flavilitoribacter nigricans DSM 23189 = NBRC 102662]